MSARRRSSVLHQIGHDLPSDLKKLSFNSLKHKSSVSSQSSEIQDEILAQINASQSTLNDEDSVEQNLQELNFYYGIVKRHLLRYQAVSTGLFPSVSSEKNVGSVRDTLYCCMATWSLHQAYKKINDDKGKCYELGQCTVLGLQGILSCWMRQAKKLESFKANQNPDDALHVIFDMKTFGEVQNSHKYPHLQLDVVSLYLLFLVQAIASGLQIIGTQHEVAFVQNLVFYVERAYRTPDFGMWQRGSVYNNGEPEVNASSIGMAKAALESINGFNLFGENGANWSVIYVDIDAHNRNRSIFETILPRESGSKECDAALLSSISFPAFATHDEELYKKTKANIISGLQGNWGFKRFSRDGFGCVLEPKSMKYTEGMTQKFEGIESEWPIFHAFMIIDGVFKNQDVQVESHQRKLKQLIKYTDRGDPILPMYYYVPEDAIKEEKETVGTQYRFPSEEGSTVNKIFLWGQAMMIIADLLTSHLVTVDEIDPIRRHLPSSNRPNKGTRYSSFERGDGGNLLTHHQNAIVQVVLISESRRLQACLSTYGVTSQTPDEVEPVQIWSQWDMVKVFERLGQSKRMGLTGRPPRPIGALGSSKIYRVSGQTVLTYPLTFCSTEFYISQDLALLTDHIRADIQFVSQRWRLRGRPTYCILIQEEFMKDPQFGEFLNLLLEIRSQRMDNIIISLGRLQNLLSSACIEHLDFSSSADLNELDIEPFAQVQHSPYETTSAIETVKVAKIRPEDVIDFTGEYQEKSDGDLLHEIHGTQNIFKRVQLLGILLARHGENFPIMADITVKHSLEECIKEAGHMRNWSAVRYSSSLLRQMIDSISPYVTQILVSGKRVTVGTIGRTFTSFDKPQTPAEIQEAIYTNVQPFNIISAVLQQELILYCGKLIATKPELFSGLLVVRMGWLLRSLELYREMTIVDPEPIHCCSPHTIRKLLTTVLSETRAIDLNFRIKASEESKENSYKTPQTKLNVYNVRKLRGCLLRVPNNFYVDIWYILTKIKGGFYIAGLHLPQEPTISELSSTEKRFAYLFEEKLNDYNDPVYKEMAIEFFSVLSKIMKRHPEISIIDGINVDDMIERAIKLYSEDKHMGIDRSREAFLRDTVAHTSAYLGKAILINLLDAKSLAQFANNTEMSEFHCHVQ